MAEGCECLEQRNKEEGEGRERRRNCSEEGKERGMKGWRRRKRGESRDVGGK